MKKYGSHITSAAITNQSCSALGCRRKIAANLRQISHISSISHDLILWYWWVKTEISYLCTPDILSSSIPTHLTLNMAENIAASDIQENTKTSNNKRIARNTLLLYVRMLFIMGVSLYTSRVVLATLGEVDFGVYNVVGGVVVMFSMISSPLSTAITRFLTFELGKGHLKQLSQVFSTSINIQLLISLVLVILVETIGVWFLNTKMNIPADRMWAANWVLQCSIITFVINLLSVPYNATIIAHERMNIYAYISILEVSLKLLVVYLLVISPWDKLAAYAVLLAVVALGIQMTYAIYCHRHFQECRWSRHIDRPLFKEMLGFSGWNFIGAASGICRDQGVNIVLNIFCGPVVNAARGIAVQVNTAINSFVQNFMVALNPQITKSYATGDHEYMFSLLFRGARFSFYLLLFLSLPVLVNASWILHLWLEDVPGYTVIFVQLILVFAMCESVSTPLITAMLATGNIRNYQLLVGGLQLLNLPGAYVLLRVGLPPQSTLVFAIIMSIACLIARLWMLRGMIGLPVKGFCVHVLGNVAIVSLLSGLAPVALALSMDPSLLTFIITSSASVVCCMWAILYVGCQPSERGFVINQIRKRLHI